ncbi:AraC family transcriptional regulator [Actinomadura kijaniata]|uniref:AraC-like DNA-binding protein n=2 Tax=Actinomadura TaxID=1988 RepID=A0A7W3QJB0_ACTNM|nr:AraC-like DNA-binding protein [Actinomadura namibiensis]
MDMLSDVVDIVRTGQPRSARVRWHAPWGQRFPSAPGAVGFQVVLQGTCWLFPPDGGAPVALGTGDVVLFPHGHGHGLADSPSTPLAAPACDPYDDAGLHASDSGGRTAQDVTAVTLCGGYRLDRSRAHPLLGELPDTVHLPARLGHRTELRAAVELLAGELDRPRPGTDAVVPALLDTLLLYILRTWFDDRLRDGAGTGWAAALADPAIAAALHAVHHDPAHPWTVASLAARAGLSRAAFAKRFRSTVGRPPLRYLTWWRMTVAARLLRASDAPLSQVAAETGYSSEFAFANAFRREHGTAPGRYRRRGRPEHARARTGRGGPADTS